MVGFWTRGAAVTAVEAVAVESREITEFLPSVRARWQAQHRRRLIITDAVVVVAVVGAAQFLMFGVGVRLLEGTTLRYTAVSAVIVALWLTALTSFGTRSRRLIGSGAPEYRRVANATLVLFGALAIASSIFRAELARSYFMIALPFGVAGLVVGRWFWRRYALRKHSTGRFLSSVLVVGSHYAARATAIAFHREPSSGFRVVGVCTPAGPVDGPPKIEVDAETGASVPVVGTDRTVLDALDRTGADTVAITPTDDLGPGDIRKLAWDLDSIGVDLIVTPGVVDITGQRIQTRPVAGMPMLHIARPQHHRARSLAKTIFDYLFASMVLIMISPILVAAAVAVRMSGKGPIFYKSERIGMNGVPFPMIKFRSMVQDADAQVDELLEGNEGAGVLFKMRDDPRVTNVGKFLRRYSLDELPQFFNVIRGEMSVVGPRPALRREVDQYNGAVRRRMMVKPGLTGLWQVSGRSDLSWNETIRLDLSYIENWSMMQDLNIIKKTVSAVVGKDGAY